MLKEETPPCGRSSDEAGQQLKLDLLFVETVTGAPTLGRRGAVVIRAFSDPNPPRSQSGRVVATKPDKRCTKVARPSPQH